MRKYELLAVLPGTLDEAAVKQKSEEIAGLLKECGAEISSINALGKNRLAYPIKQIRYGYFYTVVFSCEPDKMSVIRNKLTLARDLLRIMLSQYNEKSTPAKKITLADMTPITGEEEETRPAPEKIIMETQAAVKEEREEKPIDLKDIDKKLDEILSDESLVSGV